MAVKKQTKKVSQKKKSAEKTKKSTSTEPAQSTELDKVIASIPDDQKDKLQEIKVVLDKFKEKIVPRLEGYVMGISLLPPSKDEDKKDKINALILIDDQDSKKLSKDELFQKLSKVVDEVATSVDKDLMVETLLLTELWQQCYDGKHDMLQMIAMGATVYDTGMVAAIKISEVHKSMVLKKFEKYIVSYVLAGSLTQGRATPESDIDVFIVIDDTDVKKMTRVELRDKLRAIILSMGAEAGQMTGIQNKINIQVYILTDFWENIKDASPVIFTFLRDGIPFYDRGVFMPWKQLLQMGRVKPSPEAIEMYMGSGNQIMERIEAKMRDIVVEDLFWALLTPSQAALMMYGIPPTTPKETPEAMRSLLVKKEGLLEDGTVKHLEKVLKTRKEFEHGTKKTISGQDLDAMVKASKDYLTRLEKLFKEIEEKKQEEKVLHVYEQIVTIVRDVLRLEGIERVEESELAKLFKKEVVAKGYLAEHYDRLLKEMIKAKKDYDAKKLTKQEVHNVLKDSKDLIRALIDHIQRKRGQEIEKTKIRVKYGKDKFGEVILLGDHAFVVKDVDSELKEVSKAKITKFGTLIDREKIGFDKFEEELMSVTIPPKVFIKSGLFEDLKTIFGDDVEVLVNY